MGCPGDPASRCRHRIRGGPAARLWRWSGEGLLRLAAGDVGASPTQPDADGRSVGKIHHRSVSERQVGDIAPRRLGDRVVTDEGRSHADPAIPRPHDILRVVAFLVVVFSVSGLGSAFLPSATASRWPRMGRRLAIR